MYNLILYRQTNLLDFKELFQAPSSELNSRSGQSNLREVKVTKNT